MNIIQYDILLIDGEDESKLFQYVRNDPLRQYI